MYERLSDSVNDARVRLRVVSAILASFTDLKPNRQNFLNIPLLVKNGECGNGLLSIVSLTASWDCRGLSVSLFALRLLE